MTQKYSISLRGHRTSFSIEAEFHEQLKVLAAASGRSLSSLIAEIDDNRPATRNLSSAVRLYVLRALRDRQP
jgi:predicted DNA-binding ribbon-helix-helix protein